MSAEKLKQTLQEMPDTGLPGFEGLLKRLLELSLGEQFILARAGDQPSGDAHNLRRDVCVQAKRYTDASPQAKNIEGDFDESLRTLPNTDIYVLGVTRRTAQLDDTLNAMREKSAVDVVVWDFDGENSALPVLCVEYWEQLQEFPAIKAVRSELNTWVSNARSAASHKERLNQLLSGIRDCTQTFSVVRQAARAYLSRRFQLAPTPEPLPLQPIQLHTAVDRSKYRRMAIEWWAARQARVLVVKGEEGYGKTWVAAQCAGDISEQEGSIVLWLDSIQWRNCTSVDDVLGEAVSRLVNAETEKVLRIVRKLRNRWSGQTLIALDGVSERDALPAAQQIMEDLSRHPGTLRLMFTTRPLDLVPKFDSMLWRRCVECKLEPFNDEELAAALVQAHVPLSELTGHLQAVARIPRYFRTCLRLRDRLREFANISVALVLWTDLLDKINGLEPAIREMLGFTQESDAVEVLVKLAATLPEAVARGEAQDLLNRCFHGKYAEVRNYLKEIRIMEKAGVFEATLSREHTILGRALFLRQVLQLPMEKGVRDTANMLLEKLEPLAGEDGGAEALFVTLQLTVEQQSISVQALSRQRAALLFAWVFGHNSHASNDRLAFWCDFDTVAYAQFTEAFFEQLYSGNAQEFVVNPLAALWQLGGTASAALEPFLRRWLLLVWFEGCTGTEFEHEGHKLPMAATDDQLRLASLVVSFLSLRNEQSFLKDLALCLVTESLSWRQVGQHRHEFKSSYENIGVLMRWHYTERILPELQNLATANASDGLCLDGVRRLALMLRMIQLPSFLQRPKPPDSEKWNCGTPAVELIRRRSRVFVEDRSEPYPSEMNFSYLAVRDDLPPLCDEDIAVICASVNGISNRHALHANRARTFEDVHMDALWPWFAKYRPRELAKLAGELQLDALKREQPHETQPMFWFLAGVFAELDEHQKDEWEKFANAKASNVAVINGRLNHYLGVSIAEAALLLLPDERLHRWFLATAQDEGRRYAMCCSPLTRLIPLVIPDESRSLAVESCKKVETTPSAPAEAPPTEWEYWCNVAGLTTERDENLYHWARQQLLKQTGNEERNYYLLQLWLRSAPSGGLEADLADPIVAKVFDKRALRAWALNGELAFDPKLLDCSYDDLIGRLPQSFVGGVLALSDRRADLNRWGRELCAIAIEQLSKPPFERRSRTETQLRLDSNRMVQSVGFESPSSETCVWSSTAGSWGVDYGNLEHALTGQTKRQEILDEEFERWRLDESQMQKWEHYEFRSFGAWHALERWSECSLDEFAPRARALLKASIGEPHKEWHLGGFLHALACCLLPSSPKEAWDYYVGLNKGHLHLSVESNFRVPEFFVVLWDLKRCQSAEHDQLRRVLLTSARNEFEVMVQCVAALSNGAALRLNQLADEFLQDEVARERALGVSLLAWIGTEESASRLARVSQTDESKWVRHHAEWAREVTLQEKSARSLLHQLLREPDVYKLSAGLQVLKPALSPLARWWWPAIRRESSQVVQVSTPKHAAILESFWHHFDSTRKSHLEVFGRKLDEFCRGEKMDRLVSAKLAPWWNLP